MLNRVQNDDREIIYIFGYPRNGTKFAQFIFSEAINAPALTWSKKQDIVGDVRGLHRGGAYKTRHSHWNTGVFNKDPSLKTAKMAMAVRDPRDAILSIFRMWSFSNMDQCVNQFCGIKYEYEPMGVFHREGWPGYVRDWLDYGVPYVRYEDLLERPHEALVKLISDLGLPPQPDDAIYAAIENNKFNPKTQSVKGQKGISGRWKTELTGKHLNAVQNSCRHIMERLGYES